MSDRKLLDPTPKLSARNVRSAAELTSRIDRSVQIFTSWAEASADLTGKVKLIKPAGLSHANGLRWFGLIKAPFSVGSTRFD